VYPPRGECAQFFRVLHVIKEREHLTEFVHCVGRDGPARLALYIKDSLVIQLIHCFLAQ
jgi:hypothetical protein